MELALPKFPVPHVFPWRDRFGWHRFALFVGCWLIASWAGAVAAQQAVVAEPQAENPEDFGGQNRVKSGFVIDVPLPIDSRNAVALIHQLENLADAAPDNQRVTVVLRYGVDGQADASAETTFEDALKLARSITSARLQRVKVVSFVQGVIEGHTTLPILASENLIVSSNGVIADASVAEPDTSKADPTIKLSYLAIAEQRRLFPAAIVSALVDPNLELAQVSKLSGDQVFASGEELESLRQSGQVLRESVWSAAGVPLRLNAKQLRTAQIASNIAADAAYR